MVTRVLTDPTTTGRTAPSIERLGASGSGDGRTTPRGELLAITASKITAGAGRAMSPEPTFSPLHWLCSTCNIGVPSASPSTSPKKTFTTGAPETCPKCGIILRVALLRITIPVAAEGNPQVASQHDQSLPLSLLRHWERGAPVLPSSHTL